MKKEWQAGGGWHGMAGVIESGLGPSQFDFTHLIYESCGDTLAWNYCINVYCMHCKCDCLDCFCSFLLAKVRRLYDIANVLTSLGLIKKVHVTEERGRKPAFKWIGPVEFPGKTGNLCNSHLLSFCFDSHFAIGFPWVKNGSTLNVHPVGKPTICPC